MTPMTPMTREDAEKIAKLVAVELRSEIHRGDRWLDVAAAADYASISQESLRGLIKRRKIDFVRTPTNRIRLRKSAIDDWMVSRMHEWREQEHDAQDAQRERDLQ